MVQQKTEGDLIQIPEITSTHDSYHLPFRSKFEISGRKSYRRGFQRLSLPNRYIPNNSTINPIVNYYNFSDQIRNDTISTRYALISVLTIFLLSLFSLYLVYRTFPEVTEEEWHFIKLPYNIEDAKKLGIVLNRYKGDHYFQVMTGVCVTYIFLQTFAIPGSLFLSILSGFLFPFSLALALVCTCSAMGASLCFMLSQLLGRKLVLKYYPERARKWSIQVDKHRENLFNYVLFLRITPFLPNWFINLTAPVIGVPLMPFALGTFFGVAPPSFIAIQGGKTLQNMTSDDFAFNWIAMGWLIVFGCIPLLPILLKKWVKDKLE